MSLQYYKRTQSDIDNTSNLALRLTQPQGLDSTADNITTKIFASYKHPNKNEYVAVIDSLWVLPIHPFVIAALETSTDNPVKQLFTAFYGSEVPSKKALVLQNEAVKLVDLLPSTWTTTSKEDLDEQGWFPEDNI